MLKTLRTAARGFGPVVAAVALVIGLGGVPAHAVIVSSYPIKITEQELDFGGGNWLLGAPTNSGVLAWDVAGGKTTAMLAGTIYINNAAGTCARMRLETYDINHVFINSRNGGTVCAPTGALHTWSVSFAAPGHPDSTHAHVILQVQNANGTYSDVGTEYEDI